MTSEAPRPAWAELVETWNDARLRNRVTAGKIEGREADHNLPVQILRHWLDAKAGGQVPAVLHAAAVSILDRLTAASWREESGKRHFYGEAMVVADRTGQRYFLSTAPFRYKVMPHPNQPFRLHPGPKAAGQIAVMAVPDPVPIVETGTILDAPAPPEPALG